MTRTREGWEGCWVSCIRCLYNKAHTNFFHHYCRCSFAACTKHSSSFYYHFIVSTQCFLSQFVCFSAKRVISWTCGLRTNEKFINDFLSPMLVYPTHFLMAYSCRVFVKNVHYHRNISAFHSSLNVHTFRVLFFSLYTEIWECRRKMPPNEY